MTILKNDYQFRLIETTQEMEQGLNLRFNSYKTTFPNSIDPSWNIPCEADYYDLHSLHFGLFHDGSLVGYFRMIFDRRIGIPKRLQFHLEPIYQCIHDVLAKNECMIKSEPLYYLNDIASKKDFNNLLNWVSMHSDVQNPMTEVSRLIISECHRGKVVKQLIAAIFALYPALDIPYALFMCSPSQVSAYERFGLQLVNGIEPFFTPKYGMRQIMYGHYNSYSTLFRRMIDSMVQDYQKDKMLKSAILSEF